jgi:Ca-activated chloride channel family protein
MKSTQQLRLKGKRNVAALALLALVACAARADDAILVLDASGSMWGQIDGKTKVEIARSVVGGLLDDLPAERRLGLVAYGHRREADCSDIEEIVPVGTDRAAIGSAVNALGFKGRTPLSAAVKFAADKLAYQTEKATVILVSDGVETCGLDSCAVGRELEAAGVDFIAHVIGFGLGAESESTGLQCLAEATGGKYITARSAGDLATALTETVATPAAPPVAPQVARVVLRATELDGGPEITTGLTWTIGPAGGAVVLERSGAGVVETEIPPGDYIVNVVSAAGNQRGTAPLRARAGSERTVTIPLDVALAATLTVTPAAAAPVGDTVSVQWTGPNRAGDYVTIVKAGAGTQEYLSYADTNRGSPSQIRLPPEPGDYEIRYVLARPPRVLATIPFKATAVEAAFTAPATGVAGSNVEIAWTGPNNDGDWVTVVAPNAGDTQYNDYMDADSSDRVLELPVEPGAYEFRYVQAGRVVLARAPITVTAATAQITAPERVAAGASFDMSWTGPNNRSDWLTIIAPDAGVQAYGSYVDADRGSPAKLTAPTMPGRYELRYVLKGRKVIAARPIEVTAP